MYHLKPEQCTEPIRHHELSDRPWSKVGAESTDLFTFNNQTYVVRSCRLLATRILLRWTG